MGDGELNFSFCLFKYSGRPGFDPWVGKIPWSRERLPTPVFWTGEFHGLYSPWGHKESDTTERLSLSLRKRETEQMFPCGAELLQETRENKME